MVDSAVTVLTLQRQCQQYRCLLCINIDICGRLNFKLNDNSKITRVDNLDIDVEIGRNKCPNSFDVLPNEFLLKVCVKFLNLI